MPMAGLRFRQLVGGEGAAAPPAMRSELGLDRPGRGSPRRSGRSIRLAGRGIASGIEREEAGRFGRIAICRCTLVAGAAAQQLLDAADRIAFLVQALPDAAQQQNVLGDRKSTRLNS